MRRMQTPKKRTLQRTALHDGPLHLPTVQAGPGLGMVRHKYNAQRTEIDGIKFASKKEAAYYQQLLLARRSGDLLFFLQQVPFHLPGGTRYVCDFAEFWKDGEVRFTDVKGFKTPMYKVKVRMVESLYPVKILEV
jgi:hypothetical protein